MHVSKVGITKRGVTASYMCGAGLTRLCEQCIGSCSLHRGTTGSRPVCFDVFPQKKKKKNYRYSSWFDGRDVSLLLRAVHATDRVVLNVGGG